MILLDTDHINVLQSAGAQAVALRANMAASADQALLLSANLRDFEQVPNLRVENWLV